MFRGLLLLYPCASGWDLDETDNGWILIICVNTVTLILMYIVG